MLFAILFGFAAALAAPWIHGPGRSATGWILAVVPAVLFAYFAGLAGQVAQGEVIRHSHAWVPSLGISLSFTADGLSLLFALLITGVGALVCIYAGGYLAGHPQLGRFFAYLLLFMASMLGLVLADNVIALFVFWELTTLSSYLLIGFDHERDAARDAALAALLVTGIGGLALLAGLILLGQAGGTLELSALMGRGEVVRAHPLYLPILALVLAGAFTKSAQVPFHFWLPAAMEAPTPVSAYLHSATMVKAGIYLLARLNPVLGGTDPWLFALTTVGAVTMVVGAWIAIQRTDLKLILAYSTVSALGVLTMLLGLGTLLAIKAASVFLLSHALYKGALFLVAGAVDHETGTRHFDRLGGLRKAMPITALAAVVAGLSMAGMPPFFGFLGKELLYEAASESPLSAALTSASLLASMLFVAIAGIAGIKPFFGKERDTPKHPHEAPVSLWLGPSLLAGSGLLLGLLPVLVESRLLAPAATAVFGQPIAVHLALWHGWSPVLALSAITIGGGIAVYAGQAWLARTAARLGKLSVLGPERWYQLALDGLNGLARAQTRILQNGYLRVYLLTVVATTVGLLGAALIGADSWPSLDGGFEIYSYDIVIAALMLVAAVAAACSRSRLGAVALLGAVGYGVALVFIVFGAPDLAMTQFLVESLTVILFVLTLYHLPDFTKLSPATTRLRDAVVAGLAGAVITALVWTATRTQIHPPISPYFGEQAVPAAHGRNIVNVILVDFRALDTLGEITVLGIAALGVFALLKFRKDKSE
jgi:multicomponent Na+:H+ antiporter subunit A